MVSTPLPTSDWYSCLLPIVFTYLLRDFYVSKTNTLMRRNRYLVMSLCIRRNQTYETILWKNVKSMTQMSNQVEELWHQLKVLQDMEQNIFFLQFLNLNSHISSIFFSTEKYWGCQYLWQPRLSRRRIWRLDASHGVWWDRVARKCQEDHHFLYWRQIPLCRRRKGES